MKLIKYMMLIACTLFVVSCAAKIPPELSNARQAYLQASAGPAAQLAPVELHNAKDALNRAEASFKKDPTSSQTKDLAYVAERKAELAMVLASTASQKGSAAQANKEYQATQGEVMKQTKEDLAQSQKEQAEAATAAATAKQQAQLESEKRAADVAAAAAADKLAVEQQARLDAEKRAADAQAELARVAAVKEEARGLVITLSGSVVFASNKSTLLPEAQSRLNQVAEALMSTSKNRKLTVEGHTDSQGSAAYNMELSQRRAEAVRSYLISRGYPAELIEARGIGKDRPIADNATPEGRANNRRVEIIVNKEAGQ